MKPIFPRETFVPKGSYKISDKKSDAIAYLYTTAIGNFGYVVFVGKKAKPVANYHVRSELARIRHIKELFDNRQSVVKRAAERRAFVHDYKVGEILVTCWGYEQTNREWFEITEIRGKELILREIAAESIETGSMQGHTAPLPGSYVGEPIRRRAGQYGVRIDDVRTAWCADTEVVAGVRVVKPVYWTAYH